jgi:UDP-N-acetylmuramate--alanine ligase
MPLLRQPEAEWNVANALAAVAVASALEVPFDKIASALAAFKGIDRRFDYQGTWRGAQVVDDYAHHPTEVEATLQAARETVPQGRVHAVFQPHLFSRTRDQAHAFGRALLGADRLLVTSIFPAREEPIEGVTHHLVIDAARRAGHRDVVACDDWNDAPEMLAGQVEPGDIVLTLGAGDVRGLARELARLGQEEEGEDAS